MRIRYNKDHPLLTSFLDFHNGFPSLLLVFFLSLPLFSPKWGPSFFSKSNSNLLILFTHVFSSWFDAYFFQISPHLCFFVPLTVSNKWMSDASVLSSCMIWLRASVQLVNVVMHCLSRNDKCSSPHPDWEDFVFDASAVASSFLSIVEGVGEPLPMQGDRSRPSLVSGAFRTVASAVAAAFFCLLFFSWPLLLLGVQLEMKCSATFINWSLLLPLAHALATLSSSCNLDLRIQWSDVDRM